MSSPPSRGEHDSRGARNQLTVQLEPVVQEAVRNVGLDLDLLDVQQAGRRRLVKVVVDSDDGVELDQVAEASRAVATALDAHDHLMAGPYTLEVTSPGVDRPLTRPVHWRRARFRLVRIRPTEGAEIVGRVGASDDTGVEVLVDGALRRIEYRTVERAAVEVEFRQPPAEEMALLERGDGTPGHDATQETKEESR
ncbi:ribosome maturation factor RimP [Solihabitans fulvus]|uniref:Ribosome maturation factor RimP n=1 Tax=Solihabitans fulvus TaxID=1892852 RepID=A0A5B2X5X1_9PSEU|nr:ribosome maturation factor RimP [Solihabitans fulvus]KAA2258595.1 ribosome maturation factor RimP [Solihabitans fulvus]